MANDTQAKLPQYKWLAHQLRSHIGAGALKPGDRMPSWSEMQRTYGVNKYTIERAQKELTDEGLLVCRQGSGTFVASPAARGASRRKQILGMCGLGFLNTDASPYWAQLMLGMQEAAQSAGNHLLLLGHDGTDGWEKADGLLLSDPSGSLVAEKVPPGLPCVSMLTPIEGMCSVYSDDAAGIRMAVEHLLQLGHRRIAYLHGIVGPVAGRRIAAYRAALRDAGITIDERWMRSMTALPKFVYTFDYGTRFVETGRANMAAWLEEDWADLGCTALLAHNDDFARGIIASLKSAGYRVPEDISVIGFDRNDVATRADLPLTTIEVPLQEIGRRSVELLLQQIEADNARLDDCVMPVSFHIGKSTAPVVHK